MEKKAPDGSFLARLGFNFASTTVLLQLHFKVRRIKFEFPIIFTQIQLMHLHLALMKSLKESLFLLRKVNERMPLLSTLSDL